MTVDEEVDAVMAEISNLKELAGDEENLPAITALFQRIDVQVYAKFKPVKKKKRVENQLTGGIITWGTVPSPIQKYQGATSRAALGAAREINQTPALNLPGNSSALTSGTEDKSLGNVSRGERSFTQPTMLISAADWQAAG